jgi:hypothetical protein
MVLPDSPTGLYWSVRGQVACPSHATQLEDSRWVAEKWVPMPAASQGFRGIRYQCEYCSPDHTAVVHSSANPSADATTTSPTKRKTSHRNPGPSGRGVAPVQMLWRLRPSPSGQVSQCQLVEHSMSHFELRIAHGLQDATSTWFATTEAAISSAATLASALIADGWTDANNEQPV